MGIEWAFNILSRCLPGKLQNNFIVVSLKGKRIRSLCIDKPSDFQESQSLNIVLIDDPVHIDNV